MILVHLNSQIKIINRIPIGTLIKDPVPADRFNDESSRKRSKTLAIPQAELFKPKTFARFQ